MDNIVSSMQNIFNDFRDTVKSKIKINDSSLMVFQQRLPVRFNILLNHQFQREILRNLTSCSQCGDLIWLTGQQCKLCKLMCHRKCLSSIRDECVAAMPNFEKHVSLSNNNHSFVYKYFYKLTICSHCGTLLLGVLEKQGLKCSNENCDMAVHEECLKFVPKNCGTRHLSTLNKKKHSGSISSLSESRSIETVDDLISYSDPIWSIQDFELLTVISSGAFGKVYLAKLKEQTRNLRDSCNLDNNIDYYAIKVVKKTDIDNDDPESAMTERRIVCSLKGKQFFTNLVCSFQTKERLFYVMDYDGQSLSWFLKDVRRFDEKTARFCMAGIVIALKYLHRLNLIHYDIKLENVLVDMSGHLKLTDFGLSSEFVNASDSANNYWIRGTPIYMSPEMIQRQRCSFPVDWWALGILSYEMLFGESPYENGVFEKEEDLNEYILKHEINFYDIHFISMEAASVLKGLLNKNQFERLNDITIQTHPFFNSVDWDKMETRTAEPPRIFCRSRDICYDSSIMLSPVSKTYLDKVNQTNYKGFTYTSPSFMNRL